MAATIDAPACSIDGDTLPYDSASFAAARTWKWRFSCRHVPCRIAAPIPVRLRYAPFRKTQYGGRAFRSRICEVFR